MKKNSFFVGSWIALLVAILAWCAVALLAYELMQMQSERAAYLSNAAAASMQQGQVAQLTALSRETESNRAALETASGVDVLSAVNAIESVTASGVHLKVTDAQAERSAVAKTGTSSVNFVSLSAHTEGSFSALMNMIQILETLPLTTTIQAISFSRAPVDPGVKNATAPWTLNVRLRFLTSTQLPS